MVHRIDRHGFQTLPLPFAAHASLYMKGGTRARTAFRPTACFTQGVLERCAKETLALGGVEGQLGVFERF